MLGLKRLKDAVRKSTKSNLLYSDQTTLIRSPFPGKYSAIELQFIWSEFKSLPLEEDSTADEQLKLFVLPKTFGHLILKRFYYGIQSTCWKRSLRTMHLFMCELVTQNEVNTGACVVIYALLSYSNNNIQSFGFKRTNLLFLIAWVVDYFLSIALHLSSQSLENMVLWAALFWSDIGSKSFEIMTNFVHQRFTVITFYKICF
jgi:hypothetical protein